MKQILSFLLIASVLLISCEMYPQDKYQEYYVVEAYLVANKQLPIVRLTRTTPANDLYDFEGSTVSNANVQIRQLESGPQSNILDEVTYNYSNQGLYYPTKKHIAEPLNTYELWISFDDSDDIIKAHTVIPDTFRITTQIQDSIIYQSGNQLEITVSNSTYPNRQNIYVFNAISLNPVAENLTNFYKQIWEESETPDEDLYLFSNNNSGIFNEGNFQPNPDGSITIRYPWIGIAFFEDNLIVANTIDDNLYDFVRSSQVQLGGSTLSPGEIQNVIYHVEGGIGVFGSMASDTVKTYVKRASP